MGAAIPTEPVHRRVGLLSAFQTLERTADFASVHIIDIHHPAVTQVFEGEGHQIYPYWILVMVPENELGRFGFRKPPAR